MTERISDRDSATVLADRAIWRGLTAVVVFVVLAKVIGAAKEVVVAWRFGVGHTADAYLFLFTLVSWPVGIWASVLPPVVLPLLARLNAQRASARDGFQAQLFGLTLLLGVVLAVVAWFGLPRVLGSDLAGLSAPAQAVGMAITPMLAMTLPLGFVAALWAAWTMSEGRHLNTLAEGVPALGILLALVAFSSAAAWAWGTVAGMIGQCLLLWVAIGRRATLRPEFRFDSPEWRAFGGGFTMLLVGQFLMSLTAVVDQFFAARLGEGAISTLGYAGRILALGLTLCGTAVTRATLPVFSRLSGGEVRTGGLPDDVVRRWTLRIMLGAGVAAALGWWVAPQIVTWLYERGEFTAENSTEVAWVLRCGVLQVPFYAGALVLGSASASRARYGVLLATGAVGLVGKFVGNLALVPAMGVSALMISSALVQVANCGVLWWVRPR